MEVTVLIDCTVEEIGRVRRLLDDVLGIGACSCGGIWRPPLAQTARRLAKNRVRRRGGSGDDETPGA
ncbi:hypothetical protein [Frankia sp. Cas3]|uniref:hypothetical protein n=1 Tax=Frankia sp. Cas3 TaxID=3073926 RepID=UPI002AD34EBD|nr:hypothetical protein [Frankia sp. Cas3]